MENIKNTIEIAIEKAKNASIKRGKVYRFDVFKGIADSAGKIQKVRSIGSAQLMEGAKTYTVYLKTLLKDVFYLLPEEKRLTQGDYVILTREPSQTPGRKFFWNNIGECFLMSDKNTGLMRLSFDLFGANDIYMSLHPSNRAEVEEASTAAA